MITREQVADLQPGDVVEVAGYDNMRGSTTRGPLYIGASGALCVGGYIARHTDGQPVAQRADDNLSLTVVSRAPRPLYVNHDRTKPVPGDVVRDADSAGDNRTWSYADPTDEDQPWRSTLRRGTQVWPHPDQMPKRLRLLVDGTTGQVVP